MIIFEDKKKHHIQNFQEILDKIFFFSKILVAIFGFLNKGIIK